jgi:hypothetical protein
MSGLVAPTGGVCDCHSFNGLFTVAKYVASEHEEAARWGELDRLLPYDVVEGRNLLLTAGATYLFTRATSDAPAKIDGTNGRLCVGDSTTAVAIGQTDLQASTNKLRKVFDAAPTVSTNSYTAVATFGTSDANFAWNEAGVANSSSGATLLNRVVQSFGTKTSSLTWVLTFSASLS